LPDGSAPDVSEHDRGAIIARHVPELNRFADKPRKRNAFNGIRFAVQSRISVNNSATSGLLFKTAAARKDRDCVKGKQLVWVARSEKTPALPGVSRGVALVRSPF
jgi:hypothetical protein